MPEPPVDREALAGLDLATLVWSSGSIIAAITSATGEIRDANPTFQRLAGRDPRGEKVGAFVAVGQGDAFVSWLVALEREWVTRTWGALPRSDGLARDVQFTACRRSDDMLVLIGEPAATDDLASALLDVNDDLVEEHRRLDRDNERLDREGHEDALTGISNRRAFDARLASEVESARAGGPFALVMLDIDHFKVFNDRYGHPAGDAVLHWLGSRLLAAARRGDLVARYGGEEFVAILPGADAANAARWAGRLRTAMRDDPIEGIDVAVTVSAGVAAWAVGDSGAAVVARADAALYSAKRSGRDRVVAEGVPSSPPADETSDLPTPIWQASSIGIAIVEGLTVRRVNAALLRLLGHAPDEQPVGSLVHPDQATAFEDFVRGAGSEWTRGTFGIGVDAREVALDHVAWVRRRGGLVALVLEPAATERGAVEETLFELLDDLVEVQRELQQTGARLTRTLESITDAFYTLDLEWRYTYVNPEAERLQQRSRDELLGRVVWDVFPDAEESVFGIEFHRAMTTGETATFDAYYAPFDLWAAVRAFPSESGLAVYFLDITAKRAAEGALAASEIRYRTLFERVGVAILIADDTGDYVDVNEAAATLLGLPREAIIGQNLDAFVVDTQGDPDTAASWAAFRAAGEMRGSVRLRRPDGEIREAEFDAVADVSRGLHMSVVRDVTEHLAHERSVEQRVRILEALRRLSPGVDPEATANAICGEIVKNGEFADAAIYAFDTEDSATALGLAFREGRRVSVLPTLSDGRLAIMKAHAAEGPWVDDWHGAGDGQARAEMDRIGVTAAVFAPIEADGRLIGVLAAGGEESASGLSLRVPALIEFAALAGSLLGPGVRARVERTSERGRIREIIASGAFRPVFQPIVDMLTGAVLGYEALSRFLDGTPPDRAFEAAERAGLGAELEAATIAAALAAAAPLPARCFLDINVSPDFVLAREPLAQLLRVAGAGVVLEITEHVDVQDYAALREAVASLGGDVRFAVDDAGAGFASMRHILELAPSHVKLDRGLIARIDADPARQALVAGLVHFAGAIDVMLIAEGVETPAERDVLSKLGVHVGQGYLFGRPAPAAELVGLDPAISAEDLTRMQASKVA